MSDVKRYADEYRKHYDARSFELHLIAARRTQVLHSLHAYPHAHIVEVGCGLDPLFPYVDDYATFTVVEPSPDFARHATALAAARPNVTVIQAPFEDAAADFPPGRPVEFIVVSSLLHEVPDPARLLGAVHRVSGPATTTHINVPNVRSFHRLLALEMGLIDDVFQQSATEARFQRHTRFDRTALTALVETAGFRVLSFGTYFVKPFTNDQMDQILAQGIVDPRVIGGLERMIRYLPDFGSEMYVEVRPA